MAKVDKVKHGVSHYGMEDELTEAECEAEKLRLEWRSRYEDKCRKQKRRTPAEMREELAAKEPMTRERRRDVISRCMMQTMLTQGDDEHKVQQFIGTYMGLVMLIAMDANAQRKRDVQAKRAERRQEKWIDKQIARKDSLKTSIGNIENDEATTWDYYNTLMNRAAARFKWKTAERASQGKPMVPGFTDDQVSWFIKNHLDGMEGVMAGDVDPRIIADDAVDAIETAYAGTKTGGFADGAQTFDETMDEVYAYAAMAGVPRSIINQEVVFEVGQRSGRDVDVFSDWQDNPYLKAGLQFEQMAGAGEVGASVTSKESMFVDSAGIVMRECEDAQGRYIRTGYPGRLTLRDPMNTDAVIDDVTNRAQSFVATAIANGDIEEVAKSYFRVQKMIGTDQVHGFWNDVNVPDEDKDMFHLVRAQMLATYDEYMQNVRDGVDVADDFYLCDAKAASGNTIQGMLDCVDKAAFGALDSDTYQASMLRLFERLSGIYAAQGGLSSVEESFAIDNIVFGDGIYGEVIYGGIDNPYSQISKQIMELNMRAYADGTIDVHEIMDTTCLYMGTFYDNMIEDETFWRQAGFDKSPATMFKQFMDSYEPCESDENNAFGYGREDIPFSIFKSNLTVQPWWNSEGQEGHSITDKFVPHVARTKTPPEPEEEVEMLCIEGVSEDCEHQDDDSFSL